MLFIHWLVMGICVLIVSFSYRQLNEVDRDLAVKTFAKNQDFYHPICRDLVRKDLFGK